MRELTYFVLASLPRGPMHGYAIIKRAEAQRMVEAARIVTSPETKTVAGLPGRKPRTA
jgi:DNA-binding PadR family transcriptional regulator